MKKLMGVSLSLALAAAFTAGAGVAETKGLKDGIYTDAQAESGKAVFEKSCKACHVKEFYQAKLPAWNGQPLSALIDTISTTMPEDNAGGLELEEYVDVMAYIFSLLEYPAGDHAMSMYDGSMDKIIIDATY